jgi:hypothetical protein
LVHPLSLPGKAEPLPLLYMSRALPEYLADAPIMLFNKIIQSSSIVGSRAIYCARELVSTRLPPGWSGFHAQ